MCLVGILLRLHNSKLNSRGTPGSPGSLVSTTADPAKTAVASVTSQHTQVLTDLSVKRGSLATKHGFSVSSTAASSLWSENVVTFDQFVTLLLAVPKPKSAKDAVAGLANPLAHGG